MESDEHKTLEADLQRLAHQRQARALIVSIAACIFLAAIGAIFFARDFAELISRPSDFYSGNRYLESITLQTAVTRILGGIGVIFVLGFATYLYLTGFSLKQVRVARASGEISPDTDALLAMVRSVADSATSIRQNRVLAESERSEITRAISLTVKESVTDELFEKLRVTYGRGLLDEAVSAAAEKNFNALILRLADFQKTVSEKATFALAWGLSVATAGLGTLLIIILTTSAPPDSSSVGAVFHYFSRLSLVLLIEVVALFFLRQYRLTLLDEKYISNEVTNVEAQKLSCLAAIQMGDKETLAEILQSLSRTERNFTLQKGETSIFHSASGKEVLPVSALADLIPRLISGTKAKSSNED